MTTLQRWQNLKTRFAEKSGDMLNVQRMQGVRQQLPRWLLVIGILLLAWQLVVVTWSLIGADNRDEAPMQVANQKTPSADAPKQANAYDLFEAERKAIRKADKPVRKNLDLVLHGVIAKSDPKQGSALISGKNPLPQVYRVGEQVSPGVTLDEIYPTYVLLLRGETYEQLSLPKSDAVGLQKEPKKPTKPPTTAVNGEPVIVNKPNVTRKLTRYRKQLQENPMALAQLLRGKPVMRDGKTYGIQVSRGNDPTLITELGLQEKDILLSLNGIQLNDIKQLPTLIKTLSEVERFEIMLERDGVMQSIDIYLEM